MLTSYPHAIYALDAEYVRSGLAAVHLVVRQGRVAIIDTGANNAVPSIEAALAELGLDRMAVDYVIVTHVHLDHAGAAGLLLQRCPNARLVVHPRGARHMIDPGKLIQGSIAVYGGDLFSRLYGEILPAPVERVIEAPDEFHLDWAGTTLRFLDTPGHARHHFCLHEAQSHAIFTGDSFGISYRDFDVAGRSFIFPTTTPTQFDPDAAHVTLDRLVALQASAAYLTHWGEVRHLDALAAQLHLLLERYVELTLAVTGRGEARHAALKTQLTELLLDGLTRHGWTGSRDRAVELLAGDLELNTQGLLVWRDAQVGTA